jgi:hypothetical protein
VDSTAPAESNDEENDSCKEEEETTKVKFLELLPFALSVDVELVVSWWMVEELVQNKGKSVANDTDVVAPSPLC